MIRISEKHGVNPSMMMCFYCGEEYAIALPGRLRTEADPDAEAPRSAVWDMDPCPRCKEYMKQGIILISVRDGEKGNNPHRTGKFAVVKEEALRRIINSGHPMYKARFAFIPDEIWGVLGLPVPK